MDEPTAGDHALRCFDTCERDQKDTIELPKETLTESSGLCATLPPPAPAGAGAWAVCQIEGSDSIRDKGKAGNARVMEHDECIERMMEHAHRQR